MCSTSMPFCHLFLVLLGLSVAYDRLSVVDVFCCSLIDQECHSVGWVVYIQKFNLVLIHNTIGDNLVSDFPLFFLHLDMSNYCSDKKCMESTLTLTGSKKPVSTDYVPHHQELDEAYALIKKKDRRIDKLKRERDNARVERDLEFKRHDETLAKNKRLEERNEILSSQLACWMQRH